MDEAPQDRLAQTLAGETRLDIGAVLQEAWRRVPGSKALLFGSFVAFYALMLPAFMLLGLLLAGIGLDIDRGIGSVIAQLLVTAAVYPFFAGIFMVSLRWIQGRPVAVAQLLENYDRTLQLVGLNVLMSLGILAGLILFVIPGIYLAVAWILALPLVVDRNLGVFEALETSRRVVTKHWFSVFAFVLVSGLAIAVGALTFGIALIWAMPWMALAYALLYRELVGSQSIPPAPESEDARVSVEV